MKISSVIVSTMIKYLIFSLRPKQWSKNIIIFVALVFSQNLLNLPKLLLSFQAFFIFCLLSGSIYIYNDLLDRKHDVLNPKKAKRPIAAGQLNLKAAVFFATFFLVISLFVALKISVMFFLTCLCYVAIQIFYSLYLKHVVILDVFCIAFGFVLRLISGAVGIEVPISSWFIICTLLISLFLALSKRRSELLLSQDHHLARPVLKEYSSKFLDQSISLLGSVTVMSYTLYTLSSETVSKFHTKNLIFTIPYVLYGVLRYLYLIYNRQAGDEPEMLLIMDKPLIFNISCYIITVFVILYF